MVYLVLIFAMQRSLADRPVDLVRIQIIMTDLSIPEGAWELFTVVLQKNRECFTVIFFQNIFTNIEADFIPMYFT